MYIFILIYNLFFYIYTYTCTCLLIKANNEWMGQFPDGTKSDGILDSDGKQHATWQALAWQPG